MTVHLLGVPNCQSTRAYDLDGFNLMTIRFAAVLKRLGYRVVVYGSEENDAPCDDFVSCVTKGEQIGAGLTAQNYQNFVPDPQHPLCSAFNARAAERMRLSAEHGDILATITGSASYPVWLWAPQTTLLEYSIGYKGVIGPYRVYQSHAWRHACTGMAGVPYGREADAVIPPFFEADAFGFTARPEPYVLFCGRITEVKGITHACQMAQAAGVPFKVIGFGKTELITYGEYLGAVPTAERNHLLAHATAVLMPTQGIEPFGNVAAEAQLCGTPVITTDYGAFPESVEQGVSGFRCHYLGEYVQAIHAAGSLDRAAIRARAQRLYSMDAAEVSYRQYFHRLQIVTTEGWRGLTPSLDPSLKGHHGSLEFQPRAARGTARDAREDGREWTDAGVSAAAVA